MQKKQLLHTLYTVYAEWIDNFPLECSRGCSACCTQSVTMSSLEGREILGFAERNNREKWLREKLARFALTQGMPAPTMNQFARACLDQREISEDSSDAWNFTPCVFLEEDICTIYEVRPFGCRSFGSLVRCADAETAQMSPIHLAVNTVFTQIVEHLSSDSGYWAPMGDILTNLLEEKEHSNSGNLLTAQPIPGFLLAPYEARVVLDLLRRLNRLSAGKRTFSDLIDNFMLME
jgi:Fe-S-cluster containining protein